MSKKTVIIAGHELTIKISLFTGWEQVMWDNIVVSTTRSFFFLTAHSFTLDENGESVTYEVNIVSGFSFSYGYIVRRNGIIVAHLP